MATTTTAPVPHGFCHCRCGERTNIAPGGQPRRFVAGHQARKCERWEERDCGYSTPCHIWLLFTNDQGYGWEQDPSVGVQRPSHIVAWEAVNGPVPRGLHLDHLCHDPRVCVGGPACLHRRCRNPEHLEPVTPGENARRGATGWHLRERTHCPHGHPYGGENLLVRADGGRVCRACQSAWNRQNYRRRKAAGLA